MKSHPVSRAHQGSSRKADGNLAGEGAGRLGSSSPVFLNDERIAA